MTVIQICNTNRRLQLIPNMFITPGKEETAFNLNALSKGLGGGSMAWFGEEAAEYCAPC